MAITRNRTAEYMNVTPSEVKIIDGVPMKFSDIIVHTFRLGDVEDPEIYAAEPIWQWQQTPAGRWVMEHAVNQPWWTKRIDYQSYGYEFNIVARLSEADQIFFRLKYVGTKN
jgi:hypothetical protein